jgi:opacity protein-like surface antigen
MKKSQKIIIILSSFLTTILGSTSVLAQQYYSKEKSNYYLGLDILQTNYSTTDGYGRNIFAKNPLSFNFFLGYRFKENFFLEAGYETTGTKERTIGGVNYGTLPGMLNRIIGGSYTINTKIKLEHPYIGVGFEHSVPFFTGTSAFGLIGISATKIKASLIGDNINMPCRSFNKRKVSPILKAGLQHDFTRNFGMHFIIAWHKLTNFKLKSNELPSSVIEIRMKDGYTCGVGAIYSF